jgi:hypothetical protein
LENTHQIDEKKFYPHLVNLDGGKSKIVKSAAEHQALHPEDFEAFCQEVGTPIPPDPEKLRAEERKRCAKIVRAFVGIPEPQRKKLAALIVTGAKAPEEADDAEGDKGEDEFSEGAKA